jgi:hypothetical protein
LEIDACFCSQIGQNAPEELALKDFQADLDEREKKHFEKVKLGNAYN